MNRALLISTVRADIIHGIADGQLDEEHEHASKIVEIAEHVLSDVDTVETDIGMTNTIAEGTIKQSIDYNV
jgi:hypothetical protein